MTTIGISQRRHRDEHTVHRLAHAVYGLIVLTAVVGELFAEDRSASTVLGFVAAGAAVLVVAHSYSQLVALFAIERELPRREVGATLVDQLALGVPAVAALVVFLLADNDVISLDTAYRFTLTASFAALFVLGVVIGWHRHRRTLIGIAIGVLNVLVGGVIVVIEQAASH